MKRAEKTAEATERMTFIISSEDMLQMTDTIGEGMKIIRIREMGDFCSLEFNVFNRVLSYVIL